ncbi:MAG: hypothetical protein MUE85_09865 [Microscillaceae bacterium]|jgi:hypothetical protein|nr:hypothetical protein [Microscillaceae bacterium]
MINHHPHQEKELIEGFFGEARQILATYFEDRNLVFSNSQLFAFVLISPVTIAIASDGNLDMTETTMLVDIASFFERGILATDFDRLTQPPHPISDREFKRIIYSELRYICLNMARYEKNLLQALKKLIELDEQVSHDLRPQFSIRARAKEMMYSVIYNNLGVDKAEEAKIKEIFNELEAV